MGFPAVGPERTALHGAIGIAHDVLSFAAQPIDLLDQGANLIRPRVISFHPDGTNCKPYAGLE